MWEGKQYGTITLIKAVTEIIFTRAIVDLCNLFVFSFINVTCRSGFISLSNVIHFLHTVLIVVCGSKTEVKYQGNMIT